MKGKYIIVFCMTLVLSLTVVSPRLARANNSVNDADVLQAVQAVRNNISEASCPYYIAQKYVKYDGAVKVRVSVCSVPMSISTKYADYGVFHPSDCRDRGDAYVHTGNDMYTYDYVNGKLSTVNGTCARYCYGHSEVKEWIGLFANHDVYNLETGELFFRVAPPRTELAAMVEQSTRHKSPMSQVIYLLPLGIFLVVSFLALRKCFRMLRTIFCKA